MKTFAMTVLLLSTLAGVAAGVDEENADRVVDADFESLMSNILPRAKRQIRAYGGFLPFGGALTSDGQIGLIVGERPASADEMDETTLDVALSLRLFTAKEETQAVGMVVLVHAAPPGQTEKTEAIWIRVEHRLGAAKSIFYPYEVLEGGRVHYDVPFSIPESRSFFEVE